MAVRKVTRRAQEVFKGYDLDRMLKDAETSAYDAYRNGTISEDGIHISRFRTGEGRESLIVFVDTNEGVTTAETSRENDAAAEKWEAEEMDREVGRVWGWLLRHIPAPISLWFIEFLLNRYDEDDEDEGESVDALPKAS